LPYRVAFNAHAARAFRKLHGDVQERFKPILDGLRANPRPRGSERVVGMQMIYRIRSGDYRLLYEVHDKEILILVIDVGHRREVYRSR
jgi:mRNA interferase RelE/StbE